MIFIAVQSEIKTNDIGSHSRVLHLLYLMERAHAVFTVEMFGGGGGGGPLSVVQHLYCKVKIKLMSWIDDWDSSESALLVYSILYS